MCQHYKIDCSIFTPCCSKYYPCRQCHDISEIHVLDRYKVDTIRCNKCQCVQEVSNKCKSCDILFSENFCPSCNLWSEFKTFHCDSCNICYKKKPNHCDGCNLCYDILEGHNCFKTPNDECCVCYEPLLYTVKPPMILPCSHCIHVDCCQEMLLKNKYQCPLCKKTMIKMDWQIVKDLIENYPVNEQKIIKILCNDCLKISEKMYHPFGCECPKCGSFNTTTAT